MNRERDERALAVENASFRWGYLVLSFGLLLDIALRGLVVHANEWDLMALVIVAGLVTTGYQARFGTLGRRWAMTAAGALVMAVVVGVLMAVMR